MVILVLIPYGCHCQLQQTFKSHTYNGKVFFFYGAAMPPAELKLYLHVDFGNDRNYSDAELEV